MNLRRRLRPPLAAILAVVAAAVGCTVTVEVGIDCEDDTGLTRSSGEDFDLGCRTCTCNGDGTVSCEETRCTCEANGAMYEHGATIALPGTCGECTCLEGEMVCDEPVPNCPAPPPGCRYAAPTCDGGNWECGPLVCDDRCSVEPPPCAQPLDPTCLAAPECIPGYGWECFVTCDPCGSVPPACPPNAFAECTASGWVCVPYNETCGEVSVACEPTMFGDCSVYPTCSFDGQWSCQESCAPENCVDEPPPCGNSAPACTAAPVCTSTGYWECSEYCP